MTKCKSALAVLLCLALIFTATACGGSNATLAKVGGASVHKKTVDEIAAFVVVASYGANISDLSPEEKSDLTNQVLIYLVDYELLKTKFKDQNIITSEVKTSIDTNMKTMMEQATQDGSSTIRAQLQSAGVTEDSVRTYFESQYYMEAMYTEVEKDNPVTDEEIQQYYDLQKDSVYSTPGSIEVAHILIGDPNDTDRTDEQKKQDKEEAEKIRKEAVDGADFTGLVTKYSVDEGTKADGGKYTVTADGTTDPAFEEAAFKLKKDEISPVVQSQFGFHIIKALADPTPTEYQPLDQVKADITNAILQEHVTAAIQKLEQDNAKNITWEIEVDPDTGLPPINAMQKAQEAAAASQAAIEASGGAVEGEPVSPEAITD